jgi:hypothetical protein
VRGRELTVFDLRNRFRFGKSNERVDEERKSSQVESLAEDELLVPSVDFVVLGEFGFLYLEADSQTALIAPLLEKQGSENCTPFSDGFGQVKTHAVQDCTSVFLPRKLSNQETSGTDFDNASTAR